MSFFKINNMATAYTVNFYFGLKKTNHCSQEIMINGIHAATSFIWRQKVPLKHWYPTTSLHGITTQKTMT
jgi:hypothetical protein